MPSTRPRIVFDGEGICNACRNVEAKGRIDWSARRKEFLELVDRFRPKRGPYDCIVPWSGGKDSSSIAHRLKFEFGLNPLLVTFSPLIPNAVGQHNREVLLRAGFDQFMMRPNQQVSRHLAQRFFVERGNPKVHWDAGINALPVSVAVQFGIPLILYAEHGESEYGGRVLSPESQKIRNFTEVVEHQIGDDPRNWVDDAVTERSLAPYIYPDLAEVERIDVKALYFAYFFRWDVYENYLYIKDKIDFRLADGGRTQGTFNGYDSLDDKIDTIYYYMQFVKFGFGRAVRDASRLIQNGHMGRSEGLELARKYDDEFPGESLAEFLNYADMTEARFHELVDLHRNPELWKFEGNQWKLRFPVQ